MQKPLLIFFAGMKMSMVEEYSPDRKPEKEQVSPSGGCSRNAPRECWLDLGRVVGLFFIVLFHAAGNGVEFPLFFQRVPFLFMAAAYFVGRRKMFDWRHSPCRYVLFYLAWNGAAFLEAFFRHWIYLSLGRPFKHVGLEQPALEADGSGNHLSL